VHLTKHPLEFLLYSPFLCADSDPHLYAITFLPIYAALEQFAQFGGGFARSWCNSRANFWKIVFPLSIPGVLAGATFAFVLSLEISGSTAIGGPSEL